MKIHATIDELISWGKKQEISYRNLHRSCIINDKEKNTSIKIPLNDLVTDYRYYLNDYMIPVVMNDAEYEYYRYEPKKLSNTLYGTTEYWHILLIINNCVSKIDFDLQKLKVLDPMTVVSFINEMLILENVLN